MSNTTKTIIVSITDTDGVILDREELEVDLDVCRIAIVPVEKGCDIGRALTTLLLPFCK